MYVRGLLKRKYSRATKVFKMNIFYIYLLLAVNFVTTVVTYYRKCYEEFSACLITNTDNPLRGSEFRLNQRSAVTWCIRNSSSLAVITNANVQSALAAFITDSSAKLDSDVIITNGYRHNLSNWEWISGRAAANYPFSAPSYYRYGYVHVSAGRNATIYGSIPTIDRKFICTYRTRYSSCPNDRLQFGNSCCKIHNKEASWFEARNLCLQEKNDLATFEDNDLSSNSGRLPDGEYWIGLRSEIWYWLIGQTRLEIKYSNWDAYNPYPTRGNCLCLTANTGKWKDCDCSGIYCYICIQDYTPDSTAPTTTRITTSTTKPDGQPTLTTIVDGSYKQPDDSEDSGKKNIDSQRLIIWVPLAILIILIVVVVAWIVVKKYCKRNRNMLGGGSAKNKTHQHSSSVDAYATLNPETSTKNRTYDQLQLYETIGDNETDNNKPMAGGSSKTKTNQSPSSVDVYATLMPETSTENRNYAQLQLYETIGDETK